MARKPKAQTIEQKIAQGMKSKDPEKARYWADRALKLKIRQVRGNWFNGKTAIQYRAGDAIIVPKTLEESRRDRRAGTRRERRKEGHAV